MLLGSFGRHIGVFRRAIVFGPSKAKKDCYEKPAYEALARGVKPSQQ